jgi:uncharacterized protein (UPF0548 family)
MATRWGAVTTRSRRVDLAAALAALRDRGINYDEATAPAPGRPGNWHVDSPRAVIGQEPPGAPIPRGPWEIACELVREYEFADPSVIRAVYRSDEPLLGRNMLLVGRFLGLRFYMGVRVTKVVDEVRDGERVWGWGYQTLEGHLEQGKLIYEVVKTARDGKVELRLRAYSRQAPIANSVVRLGFRVFGRRTQLRFYRRVGHRLRTSVQASLRGSPPPLPTRTSDGLVIAPS